VVFASPDYGGFITWHGLPNVRAVLDDRNTLLGEEIYRSVLPVLARGDLDLLKVQLQRYNARYILLDAESKLAKLLLNRPEGFTVLASSSSLLLFKSRE
jgi:hypothetical protein